MTTELVSPPSGVVHNERFDGLEAYRGLAALLIVIFHAYQHSRVGQTYVYEGTPLHVILRNLDSSVAVFLALSGFLIFLPFAQSFLGQNPSPSARGFLIRRAIRILPLYYVAIVVVWTLRYTGGAEQWLDLLEHLTFTQIFDTQHIFWTIGPAWSLAVEVFFYLLVALTAPLLQRFCNRLQTRRRRIIFLTGLVSALITASLVYKGWAFYMARLPEENYAVYYNFLAKADLFAFGMLLALGVAAVRGGWRMSQWQALLLRLGGLVLFGAAFLLREPSAFVSLYFHTLCGLAFTLWLAATVLEERGSVWERALSRPVFNFLGLISYSVYLWHEPILIELSQPNRLTFETSTAFLVSTLILLVVVMVAGALSYYAIEYPTQYLRHLFTRSGHLVERYPD
jgi:peptidoglycan/LPS O-acetylase OafA/YrhL